MDIDGVHPKPGEPLIETVGETVEEGLELLSRVGLNDAFLFLRSYEQLSDGQKYRYRIAKLLESKRQWWVMDEFAATLDRDTAKIVAYNLQKIARRERKAVVAATTHKDLAEDLAPDVHVHKRFGKEVAIDYFPDAAVKECSLLGEMEVAEGTYEDWKSIAQFHYRSHRVSFMDKVFVLRRGDELCGTIVYCRPTPSTFGRNQVFKPRDMKELNTKLTRIARVVVHPKYRTIGAGVKLVKESLPLCDRPMVETVAVMARYNPFFEHAGMKKIAETLPGEEVTETINVLAELGFNPSFLSVYGHNVKQLEGKMADVKAALGKLRYPYDRRVAGSAGRFTLKDWAEWLQKASLEDLAVALIRLAQLNQVKIYLFWERRV